MRPEVKKNEDVEEAPSQWDNPDGIFVRLELRRSFMLLHVGEGNNGTASGDRD
jgi:hypothetical protein